MLRKGKTRVVLLALMMTIFVPCLVIKAEAPSSKNRVITKIVVEAITDKQAKIYWLSDIPGTSCVEYGTMSGKYDYKSKVDTLPRVAHLMELSGLKGGTKYYFRVCTKDIFGKTHVSNERTFTTLKAFTKKGRIYYVSPSGSDDNSGLTEKAAWKTLSHAASKVRPGDTVRILPGKYDGFVIQVSGTDVAPITFEGYNGKPFIAGKGILFKKNTSYVNLKNLKVTSSGVGIEAEYGNHINIENCEVLNTKSVGIYIGDLQYVSIHKCNIHHNGWNSLMIGVHGKGPKDSYHISITDCEIHANSKHGLIDVTVHFGNKFSHHHVDIVNNKLYDGWHSDAFYTHWDVRPVLRVFNLSGNDIYRCNYYEVDLSGLKDSYLYRNRIHDSKKNAVWTRSWYLFDNITFVENEFDKVLKLPANNHVFIRNRIKYIQIKGRNILIKGHNEPVFQVEVADGNAIIEYTDGRRFSVNGTGNFNKYKCTKGKYTIRVSNSGK